MEIDIDNSSLRDIISLIQNGKTDPEIGAMKNYTSGSTVYKNLKIAGADKSSKKWDFTNIDESLLDLNFWRIPEEKKLRENNTSFSEEQTNALRIIADDYIKRNSQSEDQDEDTKYKMFGKLHLENARFKNKDNTTKQLNVPVLDAVMSQLDSFINSSGLEKKFVVNKALEVFLEMHHKEWQEDYTNEP